MQGLEYRIDHDHLIISCNNQTSYHAIRTMADLAQTKIKYEVPPGPGLPLGVPVANHLQLEINFPKEGLVVFQIPYNNNLEGARLFNKVEKLVNDLFDYIRDRILLD